jgi:clan AA aspartic protease
MERGKVMGETYAEITLKNATDVGMVKRRLIKKSEVRTITVQAMVDTGSTDLIINEKMRKQLGLKITRSEPIELADNRIEDFPVTEAVAVQWQDREAFCTATVIPGESEALLGVLPLEAMDLMVDTVDQRLVGRHGDRAVFKSVSVRRR